MTVLTAIQSQCINHSKSIKLDELLSEYLKHKVLRPATKRCYKTVVHVLMKDNSIQYLNEVTEMLLIEWRNDVLERATAATWNNYHTHLRVLWNFALKKKWISDNIFLSVNKVTDQHLKKKTISVTSLKMMLDIMDEYEDNFEPQWFWVTLVKLFYYTGMRRHQILNLKWKDIDFLTHTIFLSIEGSKTHREWTIPLPNGCYEHLKHLKEKTLIQLNIRNIERKVETSDMKDDAVFRLQLFTDKYSGKQLSGDQVEGFFKKLSRYSGEKISSHRLRHTMATQIAQAGENPDIKSLQYILGHTDIRTTLGYVEPQEKHLKSVVNKLPKI